MKQLRVIQIREDGLVIKVHDSIDEVLKIFDTTFNALQHAVSTDTYLLGYRWKYLKE